ncbi:MAG: hypothetical protein MI750_11965 [Xanthomonadales bacterium]|nr:hypothetical protein [Xanthomonadales bacterium]
MIADRNKQANEAMNDDILLSYEEPVYEHIGPELSDESLSELRSLCSIKQSSNQANEAQNLQHLLACYAKLATSLYRLEQDHHSGQEIHIENGEIFEHFSRTYAQPLVQAQVAQYFYLYLQSQLQQMKNETRLGTLILRFDEAFYLFSALDELLQDTDCNQYFDQAFHSQASFLEWKDFIVTIAQQSQLA